MTHLRGVAFSTLIAILLVGPPQILADDSPPGSITFDGEDSRSLSRPPCRGPRSSLSTRGPGGLETVTAVLADGRLHRGPGHADARPSGSWTGRTFRCWRRPAIHDDATLAKTQRSPGAPSTRSPSWADPVVCPAPGSWPRTRTSSPCCSRTTVSSGTSASPTPNSPRRSSTWSTCWTWTSASSGETTPGTAWGIPLQRAPAACSPARAPRAAAVHLRRRDHRGPGHRPLAGARRPEEESSARPVPGTLAWERFMEHGGQAVADAHRGDGTAVHHALRVLRGTHRVAHRPHRHRLRLSG